MNLGLRWDYEKTPSYLDYVTPVSVVAALNSQDPNADRGQTYAQTLARDGIDIHDYLSDGHNRSAPTNEFQPRLGFSYDLDGDQAYVVFGGIGRSYDRDMYEAIQDLINVFNWENPVGYVEDFGAGGVYDPRVRYNPTGDITGYPRTLRATLGVSF